MGRNGAGKSTLLRLIAGLASPTRGKVVTAGRVALLLQNPGDYFLHDRIGDDVPGAGRAGRPASAGRVRRRAPAAGARAGAHQRRAARRGLPRRADPRHGSRARRARSPPGCGSSRQGGTAVLVATHDAEFAAAWAGRTILLGDGRPVADAPTSEVLGGGWYFATQTARVLGGGALLPEEGAALLRATRGGRTDMSWVTASFVVLSVALLAGFTWYERSHPTARVIALVATLAALAALGRIAFAPLPNVKPTTDIVLISGYVLGGAPGFAVGAVAALASNLFFGQGPWTPWQMVAWGGVGLAGAGARADRRAGARPRPAGRGLRTRLARLRGGDEPAPLGHLLGRPTPPASSPRYSRRRCPSTSPTRPAASSSASRSARRSSARSPATGPGSRSSGSPPWPPPGFSPWRSARPPPRPPKRAARSATCSPPRTTTEAGAARPASPPHSSTAAGPRSVWPPPAATRAKSAPRAPSTYIKRHASELNDLGEIDRTILVLVASGLEPKLGDRNLVSELARQQRGNGSFAGRVNTTAFSILALRAAGRSTRNGADRAGGRLHRGPG